ncbi:MAG: tRNA (adenosine(37)-N6)-dimethylallyltransferase MiaA [Hyphomicrobium sp.]
MHLRAGTLRVAGMNDQRPILIAGPTASGKSGLAIRLAEHYGGVVINADSMQVYRDLRILTARPSKKDEARVEHTLFGFVDGSDPYSVGRYRRDAECVHDNLRADGVRPIFVGGTGLYFKALLEGLSPIPPTPGDVRGHWRSEAAKSGAEALHRVLASRDPEMAEKLAPSDTQRIVRALEVLEATGVSLLEWQSRPGERLLKEADTVRLVVAPEREELHRRIDARFDAMMAQGALEEVAQLAASHLDPSVPIMNALGVQPLMQHVRGQIARREAVAQAQAETRQYTKRQLTWARGNMIAWKWPIEKETERLVASVIAFIDS